MATGAPPRLTSLAPQFLVDDLDRSTTYDVTIATNCSLDIGFSA